MAAKKAFLKKIAITALTALVFFAVTMPFRRLFQVVSVTEVRPAAALNPTFGLLFGFPGALGCAIGNLAADILSGYSSLMCTLGFVVQMIYGLFPYFAWKVLHSEVRLNSYKKILRYMVVSAVNTALTAVLLGVTMFITGIGQILSVTTLMLFLNNFVFCVVLGIPIILGYTGVKLKKSGEKFSLNERFILIFLLLAIVSAAIMGSFAFGELSGNTGDLLAFWNKVYVYISLDLVVFSVITVCILYYAERQITIPLEKLSDMASEYALTDEGLNTQRIVEECAKYENVHGEAGELSRAFGKMAVDIEQYIENLTKVTAEKERIGAELDVAAHIQKSMLPSVFPAFPDRKEFDIYATMAPAKEVGGDFYDFFMVDERHLAIVMADVSGKGVPAALFMVIGKTLIKDHTQPGVDLGAVFTEVNDLLCESNSEGLFITAFEGVLDLVTGEFNFVNAGHEMPFICHADGDYTAYKIRPGLVLAGMEGMSYRAGSITLAPGDKVFQYTDGVTEAINADKEFYGMKRLECTLNSNRDKAPAELLPVIKADIDMFVGEAPQFDDITMLCLEYRRKMGEKMKELTIDAVVENIPVVTDFVNEQLQAHGCSMKVQMQIDIAIDELFGNIAHYAYNPNVGSAAVRVELIEEPLSVVITFIDNGVPYDPLKKEDPDTTLSAEEREIGGLGIYMVKKSMDAVEYEYKDGQNILKITKNL